MLVRLYLQVILVLIFVSIQKQVRFFFLPTLLVPFYMSSIVQASIYLMATTNLKIDECFLCFDGNLLEDGRREQGGGVDI
jgi:hypothetical protein